MGGKNHVWQCVAQRLWHTPDSEYLTIYMYSYIYRGLSVHCETPNCQAAFTSRPVARTKTANPWQSINFMLFFLLRQSTATSACAVE